MAEVQTLAELEAYEQRRKENLPFAKNVNREPSQVFFAEIERQDGGEKRPAKRVRIEDALTPWHRTFYDEEGKEIPVEPFKTRLVQV